MKADYITHYGTDLSVVNAARVSFAAESQWEYDYSNPEVNPEGEWEADNPVQVLSDKDVKLVKYLADNGHTSCFEHQGATLRLKVPIFIARQIHRHRTFSYNEISRRYVDSEPEFFWPDKWRKRADNVKQGSSDEFHTSYVWTEDDNGIDLTADGVADKVCSYALLAYNAMLESGIAPEQARMILPQNLYTEFYMTGNLRNWAHFLKLRLDGHAQKEVQDVAKQVEAILRPLWPVSMEALLPTTKEEND